MEENNKKLREIGLEAIQNEKRMKQLDLDLILEESQITQKISDVLKKTGFGSGEEFAGHGLNMVIIGLENCTNAIEKYML